MRPLKLFVIVTFLGAIACAEDATIDVRADQVIGPVSRLLTGACIEDVNHEIYGGIYSQMIFGESFQEPPASPTINGFKAHGGFWTIRDGAAVINGADGPKLISDHAPFKDGSAGVELFFAERKGENAGLIVRVDKPGVGADKFIGYEVALNTTRQTLLLGRHVNNFEALKEVKCEVAIGRWIALEVRLAGSVIEILVDGKSVLTHDDGAKALAAGAIGLRAWHHEAQFRNLWVKTGEKAEPLALEQSQEAQAVSGMWRAVSRGSAKGSYNLVTEKPFAETQSQHMSFESGDGAWGIENQGLNRRGMSFLAGKGYEGHIWARAYRPASVFASLESAETVQAGSPRHDVVAETELKVRVFAESPFSRPSNEWQRIDFTLIPNADVKSGRFVLALREPGAVSLGHVFLQPAESGRFKNLPVRRDVAEGMINQGITALRYGGSMVNNDGYRWKKMIGPRDRRPPYSGLWYKYSTNGWGILDFMDFCEAAGFEYIPDFCMSETPQDMADFIEYATGTAETEWGRKRAADRHAAPYKLKYIELGNEERLDEKYAAQFEALANAIWAKHPEIILVVGDFQYEQKIGDPFNFTGADSKITSLAGHQRILKLAKEHNREVWFDVHIGTEGPGRSNSLNALPAFIDALGKVADGARHKVVVFELNAGNPSMRRALGNALAINAIERDGRIPICTSANGLQPDGQNDNGWNQGLLFLNPSKVWLQPPGYVTQMYSRNYLPQRVQCELSNSALDANATRSDDGKTLVLKVVNASAKAEKARLHFTGFIPTKPAAQVTELSGPLDARNTAEKTDAVVPKQSEWKHELKDGTGSYTFPAHSVTVLRME